MNLPITYLWLIPVLPLIAAGLGALARQRHRRFAATLAIGAMALSLILSCAALAGVIRSAAPGDAARQTLNFAWLQIGGDWLKLGLLLDPLAALMLVMVSFVGLLIFVYSAGYMAHDENFTRFFCFLSLFAAAMLGLVISNSLLLLFICWELVGLTSYLLIGFWFQKAEAAAAAKKAFITTRIGDLALLLGAVWLFSQTGTLLFYDSGNGCLEYSALARLVTQTTALGLTLSGFISILIFFGAVGKSGQVPLHVWLPDAMEGPTPVSALIHAATMVAAGVFLMARVYPLAAVHLGGVEAPTAALKVMTWTGAVTALFAACIAVAQTDIKRILAYSTVSQLGFMMLGLGAGGVAVGMFHLITHAFFKSLLFLGAGSVIHGCAGEQDIRKMGGLRRYMPLTFACYAAGMLALSGFPLLFSGFWSKDEILHAAHGWPASRFPFLLAAAAALLTAFYMARQVFYVFFGSCRIPAAALDHPHESPAVMTVPLLPLAAFAILGGFIGTPAWPWFQTFLEGHPATFETGRLLHHGGGALMLLSTAIVFSGLALGWWLYGRMPLSSDTGPDPLQRLLPRLFGLLHHKFYVDEIYDRVFVKLHRAFAATCDWIDRWILGGCIILLSYSVLAFSWANRLIDDYMINLGFDLGCGGLNLGGRLISALHRVRVQSWLRVIGLALVLLALALIWGCAS